MCGIFGDFKLQSCPKICWFMVRRSQVSKYPYEPGEGGVRICMLHYLNCRKFDVGALCTYIHGRMIRSVMGVLPTKLMHL